MSKIRKQIYICKQDENDEFQIKINENQEEVFICLKCGKESYKNQLGKMWLAEIPLTPTLTKGINNIFNSALDGTFNEKSKKIIDKMNKNL